MGAEQRPALPDSESRRVAATDSSTNLVVAAGAGTGKTSLLVERALVAIGSGRAAMRQIAAITFTEKAAGEMRERLALGLDRLRALAVTEADPGGNHEADRAFRHLGEEPGFDAELVGERALEAMEQLDGSTVVTIHRFCSEVLRRFPLESGVDPGFVVDSGQLEISLGAEAWERFLERELGPGATRAALWQRLLDWIPLPAVAAVARGLGGFDIPDGATEESLGAAAVQELFAPRAHRVVQEIDSLLARQSGMTDRTVLFFESARDAAGLLASEGLAAHREFVASRPVLLQILDNDRRPAPNKLLQGVTPAEMTRVVKSAFRLCRDVRQIDEERIRELIEAVAPFAAELREHLLRRGVVGFDGLLALTRRLLRDHPRIRRRLKRQYRQLLVDEFQDTDPLQYEIVLYLAERDDDDATDAYRARLEPGRLFVVGDPKQSIYRFRGADFAAYRRAIDRIVEEGGRQLDLVGNFRSTAEVLDPVNLLFTDERGCWSSTDYQPDYVPIRPVRGRTGAGSGVELWTVDLPPGARAEERREAEGRVIAERIQGWVDDGLCRYEQITILFRAFTNITHYLRPLRELGVPFVVDGGRDFLKRPEVAQLMAILRTLSQPMDQPALLAFLRSPAGGVSDTELAAFAEARGRWDPSQTIDREGFPQIARCYGLLQELAHETRQLPADAVVRRVVETMQLLPLGAAAFEGAQRVANLQKLAAAAGDLARDGKLSLEQVVEALTEGRMEDIETDRPLADDAAEAVRITSIHRMKGLENDWILLPDLARQRRGGDREPNKVRAATLPGGGTTLVVKAGGVPNAGCVWHELEDEAHDEAEEVRVFYVALTRARERLVVIAGPARNAAPWLESLSPWGYDAGTPPADGADLAGGAVRHRLIAPPAARRSPARPRFDVATEAVEAYSRAARSLREGSRPPLAAPSALHDLEHQPRNDRGQALLFPDAATTTEGTRELGKATGIAVHRLLQFWDGRQPDALRAGLPGCAVEAAREAGADADDVARECATILEGFLDGELARRFARVEKLGREVPVLLARDEGGAFRGSIDLLYRDEDGTLVVADFKTDRDANTDELRRRYGGQLEVYARAVEAALGAPRRPRAEIWLLRAGRRLVLDG